MSEVPIYVHILKDSYAYTSWQKYMHICYIK